MLQSSAPGSALARGPRTGSTAKAVTPSGLLLVEFVEHEVAQEGRERTALWGPLVHRADQAIFHHPGLEKRPARTAGTRRAYVGGRGSVTCWAWRPIRPRLANSCLSAGQATHSPSPSFSTACRPSRMIRSAKQPWPRS